jgi:DnaJ-class molecular chaperone
VYNANITLVDSLTGTTLSIPTLDGRTLTIPINEIVQPGFVKRVKAEGMPSPAGTSRGDLLITFTVSYPEFLTEAQKTAIRETL